MPLSMRRDRGEVVEEIFEKWILKILCINSPLLRERSEGLLRRAEGEVMIGPTNTVLMNTPFGGSAKCQSRTI